MRTTSRNSDRSNLHPCLNSVCIAPSDVNPGAADSDQHRPTAADGA